MASKFNKPKINHNQ